MSEAAESTSEPPRTDTPSATGRVVVGVDGSAGSVQALAWALYEARLRAVDLHVVAAWSYHPGWEAGRATMFGPQVGLLAGRLDPHTPSLVFLRRHCPCQRRPGWQRIM
jgi:Universal stress protein family.